MASTRPAGNRPAGNCVFASFTATDAALLAAHVAAHMDERFVTLDLSHGSRIVWSSIASKMNSVSSEQSWTPMMCQRLWRWVAYGDDIGDKSALLADSDGEEDVLSHHYTAAQRAALPVLSHADAGRMLGDAFAALALRAASQDATPGSDGVPPSGNVVVDATALPAASHALLQEAVTALLGPRPGGHRSAEGSFREGYAEQAKRLAEAQPRVQEALLRCRYAEAAAAAAGNASAEALDARASAAAELESARGAERDRLLATGWANLSDGDRAEYRRRERMDERQWVDDTRVWNARYNELYRLLARRVADLIRSPAAMAAAVAAAPAPPVAPVAVEDAAASNDPDAPGPMPTSWSAETEALLTSAFARPAGKLLSMPIQTLPPARTAAAAASSNDVMRRGKKPRMV